MCTTRFGQLNDVYLQLSPEQSDKVRLFGVGKDVHFSSLSNWTNGNDASVVADNSNEAYPAWTNFGASQRDLVVLDHTGLVVLDQSISSGLPSDLFQLLEDLIDEISDDCVCPEVYDPVCGVDGNSYQNSCYAECVDVEYYLNGELDNSNPCNPMECYDGQWLEIIIDCAEQMGVPCDGGVYVAPPDDACCSTCVQYGDSNADGTLDVLDVVILVNYILNPDNSQLEVADINIDGVVNVLDVVTLVNIILNP